MAWWNFRSYVYGVTYTFDPTHDSTGNPNSGSMYVQIQWPTRDDPNWKSSWNDIQFAWPVGPFTPSNYINFQCDILIDVTNSYVAQSGTSYGQFGMYVNNPWTAIVNGKTIPITNGWQRLSGSFASDHNEFNSQAIISFISNGNNALTNTVSFWIDNIVFTAPPAAGTNRPLLSLAKAPPPGLTCMASQQDGTWQRQMVSSVYGNYSWDTATAVSNTTTYSMTIAAAPDARFPGFSSQMFLIPALGMAGGKSDDWGSANVVRLSVTANANGTATGHFQYKVNAPNSWASALVVDQTCATGPLGKWSLTFNNNTNVTLTAPDNSSTSFTIPESDAAYFADPLYVAIGTQPNNDANIGQASTFSGVEVTGAAGSINDTFVMLNPDLWEKAAADPAGVFITAPDAKYWISWPLPDFGFTNVYATDNLNNKLGSSEWKALPSSDTGWKIVGGTKRLTVINQSTLNSSFGYSPSNCFFGLFHP